MTLDQIIKIQAIIDKRAIRSDTLEFLFEERWSESKKSMITYGSMHLDHFFNVFNQEHSQNLILTNKENLKPSEKEMTDFVKTIIRKIFKNGTH
jgi:hypothetical protein|tara:strand:- start:41 stop:322 length:282 start_codon:yes stop_codon:yes gene_type:complete